MPRRRVRSISASCNTPFSTTATRVSIGVRLISTSPLMRKSLSSSLFKALCHRAASVPVASRQAHSCHKVLNTQLGWLVPNGNTLTLQQLGGLVQWQPHYRRMAALNPLNEDGGQTLDSITPRLVHRLSRLPVGSTLSGTEFAHDHPGRHTDVKQPCGALDRYCGQHLMATPRQLAQHGDCLATIRRLAQDATCTNHSGIRTERRQCAKAASRPGLLARQT